MSEVSPVEFTTRHKKLMNRIRRIRGQLDSIERAVSERREDSTTLQTLAACRGAITGLMSEILEEHLRTRLLDPAREPAEQARATQEIFDVFKTYLK